MKPFDISNIRLNCQQVSNTKFKNPEDVVHWMGAVQAQDYANSKWAVGCRLNGTTDKTVEAALNKGKIIRTHVMRPTWHLVSAKDIYWMLELTAPHIKSSLRSRNKQLELSDKVVSKSNSVIEKILSNNKDLTREEIYGALNKASIATDNVRGSHLLLNAELEGLICNGKTVGNKQTYTLLENKVLGKKKFDRDESIAKLGERYFSSHCPATLQDFIWWSGLPAKDARLSLELNKQNLQAEKIDRETYWLPQNFKIPEIKKGEIYLLPAFDEFIISYKNRSAVINIDDHKKAVSSNGIFRPLIVVNGKVTGLWKHTIKKESVAIELESFRPHNKAETSAIKKAAEKYGIFLGKKAEII